MTFGNAHREADREREEKVASCKGSGHRECRTLATSYEHSLPELASSKDVFVIKPYAIFCLAFFSFFSC